MIHWAWVVVAAAGGCVGILLTALCVAAGREMPGPDDA